MTSVLKAHASPAQGSRGESSPAVAVSVVVLVSERATSLVELYHDCATALGSALPFEFLVFAEPWAASLVTQLDPLIREGAPIRIVQVGQAVGDAALLRIAADVAAGDVLLVLPGYVRIEAEGYPRLIAEVRAGADLAVARRWPRRDPWINRLQSRVFHWMVRGLMGRGGSGGGTLHDIACGVLAVRREVIAEVPLYGDQFRFFPLLVQREGFVVREVNAKQHVGDTATRVYRPGIYVRRLVDILGLTFVVRFIEKPLRFFGLLGAVLTAAGGGLLVLLLIQRLGGQGIANRPLLLVANLAAVLGLQFIALGLIGEVIVHFQAPNRRPYRVRKREESATPS